MPNPLPNYLWVVAAMVAVVLPLTELAASASALEEVEVLPQSLDPMQTGVTTVIWEEIATSIDAHPRISASRQKIMAAHAGRRAAGAIPNPSFGATAAHARAIDNSASSAEWGLSISLPLDWIAQRGARMKAAAEDAGVAEAEAQALRREVLLELRLLFWSLVYEQERFAALEELREEMDALRRAVQQRVDRGEARPVEALRIEVETEVLRGEYDTAQSALEARRAQLTAWLNLPSNEGLIAAGELAAMPPSISAERAREKARLEHPRVHVAAALVQALEARSEVERRLRMPALAIGAFVDNELDRRAYGVELGFDLPLWNWNKAAIEQATWLAASASSRLAAERLDLETSVIAAQADYRSGFALVDRYQTRVLPKAIAAAQAIERTYQLGEASVLEVIDARRTLLRTRRSYFDALLKARTDHARLVALIGEDWS